MKSGLVLAACVAFALAAAADDFVLVESGPGRSHGPFKYEDGGVVRMGDKIYTLRMIRRPKTMTEQRAEEIILPNLQFRQAAVSDVIQFLQEASTAADPNRRGVAMILKRRPADRIREGDPPSRADGQVTLSLRNVSLKDAVRYVAELAGLKVRYDDNAIVVSD